MSLCSVKTHAVLGVVCVIKAEAAVMFCPEVKIRHVSLLVVGERISLMGGLLLQMHCVD